jgi:hypothetical protein
MALIHKKVKIRSTSGGAIPSHFTDFMDMSEFLRVTAECFRLMRSQGWTISLGNEHYYKGDEVFGPFSAHSAYIDSSDLYENTQAIERFHQSLKEVLYYEDRSDFRQRMTRLGATREACRDMYDQIRALNIGWSGDHITNKFDEICEILADGFEGVEWPWH